MGTILDLFAQLLNLDPSLIVETLTRQITAGFTIDPNIFTNIGAVFTSDDAFDADSTFNWFDWGMSLGQLLKIFFDFTINN
jgi:hypothetical protein